jgi:phosphoribosylformimino-5-aminoimidazole carboxamide ribonucleotide (ProFAR) isomerase
LPVSFSNLVINYDFTTSISSTYGGNQSLMSNGKYALFVGDVNNDGLVDGSDMSDTETENNNFAIGYLVVDVNGDGLVDGSDMSLVENANNNFVSEVAP